MPTEEGRKKENTASVLKDIQGLQSRRESQGTPWRRGAVMLLWGGGHPIIPGREIPSLRKLGGGDRCRARLASGVGGAASCSDLPELFK